MDRQTPIEWTILNCPFRIPSQKRGGSINRASLYVVQAEQPAIPYTDHFPRRPACLDIAFALFLGRRTTLRVTGIVSRIPVGTGARRIGVAARIAVIGDQRVHPNPHICDTTIKIQHDDEARFGMYAPFWSRC